MMNHLYDVMKQCNSNKDVGNFASVIAMSCEHTNERIALSRWFVSTITKGIGSLISFIYGCISKIVCSSSFHGNV